MTGSAEWIVMAILLIAGAGLVTGSLITMTQPWMRRYALARPNARSSHREPTPQGGGAAIVLSMIVAIIVVASLRTDLVHATTAELAVILGASVALAVVGAVDDIKTMSPMARLVAQLVTAVLVITTSPESRPILPFVPTVVEQVILVLALVWFVNLVNFMDGIDWMTVAEMVPMTIGIALLGVLGHSSPLVTVAALSLCGGVIGFAPFNRPVARLFLGDVGSLPIGLLVGWMLLVTARSGEVVAAMLLPLYYLADATITLLKRLSRGERVWEAHRSHFYQQATQHGWPVIVVITRVFALNVALATLAVSTVVLDRAWVDAGALVAGAALTTWLLLAMERRR
ncbi:MAG: glycosyltransferase family 4 protein [Kofleriaceae bacterium]